MLSLGSLLVCLPVQYPPEMPEALTIKQLHQVLNGGKPPKPPQRQAAKQLLLGWHNQLQRVAGLSFAEGQPEVVLMPVQENQQRVKLSKEQAHALHMPGLDVYIQGHASEGDGMATAEVPATQWCTPGLATFKKHTRFTITGDEGSQGWAAFSFLASQLNIAILWHRDPMHKLQRSYERAVLQAVQGVSDHKAPQPKH